VWRFAKKTGECGFACRILGRSADLVKLL